MIASISASVEASATLQQAASTGRYHFFKFPDLSDETSALITKASAWPTLVGIQRAIRQQSRRGRTVEIRQAAEAGRIGVGLKAIARAMGMNASTVRRQVGRLERIGLCAVVRPKVLHVADPLTGKIATKHLGRTPPCLIYLTVTDAHLRPARRGAKSPPSPSLVRAHIAPPSKESKTQRGEPARLVEAAGRARQGQGRHTPAKASQEQVINAVVSPDEQGITVTMEPAQGRPATPTGESRPQDQPRGEAATLGNVSPPERKAPPDANDSTADGSGFDASLGSMADEFRRLTGKATKEDQEAAIANLRASLDALPPASRARARKLGRKAKKEAKATSELIATLKARQAEQATARKEAYRAAWKAEQTVGAA